jgi:hypothetical protein
MRRNDMTDFHFYNYGSICLLDPRNDDAETWLTDNVQDDAQWHCGKLVIEPRYVDPLLAGAAEAGFSIG